MSIVLNLLMVLGVCSWKAIVVRLYKNGAKLLECKSLEFGTIRSNGFFCIWHYYSFKLGVCIRDFCNLKVFDRSEYIEVNFVWLLFFKSHLCTCGLIHEHVLLSYHYDQTFAPISGNMVYNCEFHLVHWTCNYIM